MFWLLLAASGPGYIIIASLILVNSLQLYMFVYHGMGFLLQPAPSILTELAFYFGFKQQLD